MGGDSRQRTALGVSLTLVLLVTGVIARSALGAADGNRLDLAASANASGGEANPADTGGVLHLTLADAVTQGLEHNLAGLLAATDVRSAEGQWWLARRGLLPSVNLTAGFDRLKINLEAYGFPVTPGESPLIGPFNVVDERVAVSQPLFDLSAVETARAGREVVRAAQASQGDMREVVVVAVAALYLRAAAADSRIQVARAQLATARVLEQRARDMKDSGMVPGIDVLRAGVQLATQEQRLVAAENEGLKAKLELARAVGIPLERELVLDDEGVRQPPPEVTLDEALARARAERRDLAVARARLAAAEASRRAAGAAHLPTLLLSADWGKIGNDLPSAKTTYSAAAGLRLPLLAAGEIHGRRLMAAAEEARMRALLADAEVGVEQDVRESSADLESARRKLNVAEGARELARQQLTQADDRFAAGVTNNLEVVQAQEALASASDAAISARFEVDMAVVSLARAMGAAEHNAVRYLGGRP